MGKLKPCPFCGGKANRTIISDGDKSVFRLAVECRCGASMAITYSAGRWIKDPEKTAKAYIARKWNRRDRDA